MVFEMCRDILLKECELVQRIAGLQNLIWEAVIKRDWADFEDYFSDLNKVGEEFAALEAEREQFFAEFQDETGAVSGFYALAARFPVDQRTEITEIYRSLKLETLRIQMFGETIMGYIAGARATIADFFQVAFPDRGGKLYTPNGIPASHDMRSMVLNQCF